MPQDHDSPPNNQEYDKKKKAERARARKHKVSWVQFFYIVLLLAAVSVAIFVIEYFQ